MSNVPAAKPAAPERLPLYAAQAVIDLEKEAEAFDTLEPGIMEAKGLLPAQTLAGNFRFLAKLMRNAFHVVLPKNGEIYRSNAAGGACPTPAECESLRRLPSAISCFEYDFDAEAPKAMSEVRSLSVDRIVTTPRSPASQCLAAVAITSSASTSGIESTGTPIARICSSSPGIASFNGCGIDLRLA
jgi:hypothetical protein